MRYNNRTGKLEFDNPEEEAEYCGTNQSADSNDYSSQNDSYYNDNQFEQPSYYNQPDRSTRPPQFNPHNSGGNRNYNNANRNEPYFGDNPYDYARNRYAYNHRNEYNYDTPRNNDYSGIIGGDNCATDDLSVKTKVILVCVAVVLNIIAYKISGWWLVLTLPVFFVHLIAVCGQEITAEAFGEEFTIPKKICWTIGYFITMLTIITPLPWWSVLLSLLILFIILCRHFE